MAKAFKINEKTVMAKPFDFNTICDLEDRGINIANLTGSGIGLVRAYVSICMGTTVAEAGAEIQDHVINGGNLNEINEILAKEMNESDFFQAIAKQNEAQEDTTSKSKKA